MKKIGILTFHYSNNYGGILQTLGLYNTVKTLGYDVEVINFIPSNYEPYKIMSNLGLRKNIFKNKIKDLNIVNISKRISIMNKYSEALTNNVNLYRDKNMNLSEQVDEDSLKDILGNYSAIIVGSDQVWNPSQRKSSIYFLDFKDNYKGKKISYAADSTVKDISSEDVDVLKSALNDFDHISVRNEHSFNFVETLINKEVEIVADPTLLCDFKTNVEDPNEKEEYILTYVLGKEIDGSHFKAIEKIKKKYIYISILIPIGYVIVNLIYTEFLSEIILLGNSAGSGRDIIYKNNLLNLNFTSFLIGDFSLYKFSNLHNAYISILATIGLIGILPYFSLLQSTFLQIKEKGIDQRSKQIAFIGLLGIIIHSSAEAALLVAGGVFGSSVGILYLLTLSDD